MDAGFLFSGEVRHKRPVYSVQILSHAPALHVCVTEAISETSLPYCIRLESLNKKRYNYFIYLFTLLTPVPLAARSKALVCGRGHGCLSVVSVVCCQVEVSATG